MGVSGKHVLITGASGGIGQASAQLLARAGARLTLLCRNPDKAEVVAAELARSTGCETPELLIANFADLGSVQRVAEEFLARGEALDILLNNAGIVCTRRNETVDGFEETFAVNHLAPFLLTGLLLPKLLERPGARIVNVASAAYTFCRGLDFDDLQAREKYRTFTVYGRTKLANILFTRELSSRLAAHHLTVNALHPGAVATGLGNQNSGWMSSLLPLLLRPFFKTAQQGAATSVYLCQDESVAAVSGAYFENCRPVSPKPWATDASAARRLWDISEKLCEFKYPV